MARAWAGTGTIAPVDRSLLRSWESFAALCVGFYATGGEADRVVAGGWFAALSRLSSAELNVCGLTPAATTASASDLARLIGPDQPGIVFTSQHAAPAARRLLVDAGFTTGEISEPLMRCGARPEVRDRKSVV